MAITTTPRSVSDATRFTQNTPHAPSRPSRAPEPRFARPAAAAAASAPPAGTPGAPRPDAPSSFGETPEQRVARLRAAHEAAKRAQVSKFDQFIARGRGFFDSAHKITVMGLLSFTAIAGLVTVYTAADMIMYNRKRKTEFVEAQKRMAADSLEAARLAYMTNKATDEQVAMVEEAMRREAGQHSADAGAGIFSSSSSILGAPSPADGTAAAAAAAASTAAAATAAATAGDSAGSGEVAAGSGGGQADSVDEGKKTGFTSWLFSGLKKEEGANDSQRRTGRDREGSGEGSSGTPQQTVEDKRAYLREKTRGAFEKERENQRTGGPLDRVGLGSDPPKVDSPQKKGWWAW